MSPENRAIVEKRLVVIRRLADRAEPYHKGGFIQEAVETVISHSYQLSREGFRWTKDPIIHTCGWCVVYGVCGREIILNPSPSEGQEIKFPKGFRPAIYDEDMNKKSLEPVCADPRVLYYMAKAWEMKTSPEFENLPKEERIRLQKELLESRPTREEALAEIRRLGVSSVVKSIDESCCLGEYDAWYEKRDRDREEYERRHLSRKRGFGASRSPYLWEGWQDEVLTGWVVE